MTTDLLSAQEEPSFTASAQAVAVPPKGQAVNVAAK